MPVSGAFVALAHAGKELGANAALALKKNLNTDNDLTKAASRLGPWLWRKQTLFGCF
jgi:hypothetical protein